jgi:tape measure domain-containing protein
MKEAQRRIDNELSKAEKKLNNTLKQVQREQASTMQKMGQVGEKVGNVLTGVFVGLAVAIPTATFAMLKLNSELNSMTARVGIFSGNMKTAKDTLKELIDISLETGLGIGAIEQMFGRASLSAKTLRVDTKDVIAVTKGVAQTIALTGQPASQSAGALLQLGQALSSPIVQFEEFGSLLDGAPVLVNEMAKSIFGLGGNSGQLVQLVKSGKLTNKMLFLAIQDALPRINKQMGLLPLSLDRVINRFQLMGLRVAMAFDEFQKLAGPQKFLKLLDNLIERTTNYLIKNKDLISSKMTEFFDNATNAVNALVDAYKTFEPIIKFAIKNIDNLTAGLGALLAGYVALKVFMLVQMIPAAIQTGIAMAGALGPVGLAITGIIALLAFLELRFKLLSNTFKGIGDLWNTVFGGTDSKAVDFLNKARKSKDASVFTGGYAGNWAKNQAEAQRQGAGGNINNSQKSLSNSFYFSGTPSIAQAKSIGNNLVSSSNRAFYALN